MAYPVPQGDPTSVFGRRVLAVLIDALIVIVPAVIAVTSQFEYIAEENLPIADGQAYCDQYLDEEGGFCIDATDLDDRVYFSDGSNPGSNVVYWGLNFGLLVVLQGFTGWTPGKLVTGIRTVREDGRPPGFVKALLRWLLWIVDGFPYFLPLVGFITGLTTVGHRRVGDMAAKTFVVRKDAAGSPVSVPGLSSATPGGPWATTAPPPPGAPGGWPTPPPPGAPGAPSGWTPPADPAASGWASPTPPPPPAATPPAAPVAAEGPQWDEARGTYIQWDPEQRAWMQWDDGFKAWSRIPGQ